MENNMNTELLDAIYDGKSIGALVVASNICNGSIADAVNYLKTVKEGDEYKQYVENIMNRLPCKNCIGCCGKKKQILEGKFTDYRAVMNCSSLFTEEQAKEQINKKTTIRMCKRCGGLYKNVLLNFEKPYVSIDRFTISVGSTSNHNNKIYKNILINDTDRFYKFISKLMYDYNYVCNFYKFKGTFKVRKYKARKNESYKDYVRRCLSTIKSDKEKFINEIYSLNYEEAVERIFSNFSEEEKNYVKSYSNINSFLLSIYGTFDVWKILATISDEKE